MSEQLRRLTIKRGQIKARLTRLKFYFASMQFNKDSIAELKLRLAKFESCWNEFQETQDSIEVLDESGEQLDERDQFESSYFQLMSKIQTAISEYEASNIDTHSNSDNIIPNSDNFKPISTKLPTLSLPQFSGDYDKWLPFYDMFNSLVHTNSSLTEIQKFHYLKSSLKGEAANLIVSLQTTKQNYQIAWDLLNERYKNNRLIIQTHVKALFELPAVTKESHKELRNLLNTFSRHVRSLEALGQPIQSWGTLLVYLLSSKIDPTTKREWESSIKKDTMPTISEFESYLNSHCLMLESLNSNTVLSRNKQKINSFVATNKKQNTYNFKCPKCKGKHAIYHCGAFLNQDIQSRISDAKALRLCNNCLRTGHSFNQCNSRGCKHCNSKHNSLLHITHSANYSSSLKNATSSSPKSTEVIQQSDTISNFCSKAETSSIVLLATALVEVHGNSGKTLTCRALLDSGSQSSFLTKSVAKQLNLKPKDVNISVMGINKKRSKIDKQVSATIRSRTENYRANTKFFVLPNIIENFPSIPPNCRTIEVPTNITLADPNFQNSNSIDMLIGCELFWDIIKPEQFKLNSHTYFQNTKLGWVISGRLLTSSNNSANCNSLVCAFSTNLESKFQKFCEIEEIPNPVNMSLQEKACEKHYDENTTRDKSGRFTVKLPIKGDTNQLGDSYESALKRFHLLEKKLHSQPKLMADYSQFIHEYLNLGHMELVPSHEVNITPNYYLPHHAVIKSSSLTTKLRVVFDASAKSNSGISLNDILMIGPTIQEDLFSIIVRWRGHKFVLMADIEKMYRQVKVDQQDSNLQRIIWRDNQDSPIQIYRLNTVTYGTACGSYLAIKSLHKLAEDPEPKFQKAAKVVQRDFYVDDLMTGTDSIPDALEIRDQLIELLASGGFNLYKWASNHPDLLTSFNKSSYESRALTLNVDDSLKMLGLLWNSNSDELHYSVADILTTSPVTKRFILSKISQFFDPLGLLGPCIIKAKLLIQKLWQQNIDWDEPVPSNILDEWNQYSAEIPFIKNLKIPRYIVGCQNANHIQLHAFCDASEKAYGACVYIRSANSNHDFSSMLLCAKSRVAPLKSISLPRLELCGALLAAKLVHVVTKALTINVNKTFYWTDSKIVLAWIQSPSHQWKTFVGNRVSKIQDLTKPTDWYHVSSQSNPADIISRGANPIELQTSLSWWHGPEWLMQSDTQFPLSDGILREPLSEIPEKRNTNINTFANTINHEFDVFDKYSKLSKLINVTAYILRFIKNSKCKTNDSRQFGSITCDEFRESLNTLIKICQKQEFSKEFDNIARTNSVHKKSKLLNLNPFIDEKGLLRVGGRLRNAPIPFAQKYPIVLPANHALTKLIVQNEHILHLHAGPQTLLATIRLKYWPLGAKRLVKNITKNCLTCFKNKPQFTQPFMGDLPTHRVSPTRAFTNCGIDYAGPYNIKDSSRSKIINKAYLVIFICLATKAVHLELVTSLTSESFIATLKRFISRRGICAAVYSDNASNFTAANKELKALAEAFITENAINDIKTFLTEFQISWHFIPARSPSFGGIWESAVKSAKYHLKRVLSDTPLTFEQLYTVITQVESILNSRPITPMSDDPSDLTFLTPGHFLIGDSLKAIPEPELVSVPVNRLSKWQHLQQMTHHFWLRWSKEYLHNLQTRAKWNDKTSRSIQVDQLVLLKDDNLPTHQWPCGRIIQLHPGSDGVVRVVDVKTKNNIVTRAVSKVCPLPTND